MLEAELTVKFDRRMQNLQRFLKEPVAPKVAQTLLRAAHIAAKALAKHAPKDTSALARSFLANVGFVQNSARSVVTRAFSPLVYAHIQDQGGTIYPKTAKALAVPLSAQAKTRWPRDWPAGQLTLIATNGKALLIEKLTRDRFKLHYVLKDQVTIEGSDYVKKARREAKPQIDEFVESRINELTLEAVDRA